MNSHTREIRLALLPGAAVSGGRVPVTIATSTPVNRGDFLEVLDCSPAGVDVSRAPLPLIVSHDHARLAVGLIEDLSPMGDRVTGMARFGASPEARQIEADVIAGIHRSVSVGYELLDKGRPKGDALIFKWRPYETSIVSVPADPSAGFFRSQPQPKIMSTIQKTRDATEILATARQYGCEAFAQRLINLGATDADVLTALMEHRAAADFSAGGHMNVARDTGHVVAADTERSVILNTLVARLGGRPTGDTLRAADVVCLATRTLALNGVQVGSGESRDRIIERALNTRSQHTNSDFPALLGDAVGRVLLQMYEENPAALRAVAAKASVPDFRARQAVRMKDAPTLEKVNEAGEFKYGTVADASNSWRLSTYGRIIGISRQALLNDDLGGFAGLMQQFAASASRREAVELTALLTSPPTVEGAALFSAPRSSLVAVPLAVAGLGTAVAALRGQTDGAGLVTQEPGAIVVPAALEMTARQLVATFTPALAASVQPFNLEVIVEPRLDASSATAWFLVAKNQRALEYGYLDGEEGLRVFMEDGWQIDGVEMKARLDFGCGWVTPVGWVKSSG